MPLMRVRSPSTLAYCVLLYSKLAYCVRPSVGLGVSIYIKKIKIQSVACTGTIMFANVSLDVFAL